MGADDPQMAAAGPRGIVSEEISSSHRQSYLVGDVIDHPHGNCRQGNCVAQTLKRLEQDQESHLGDAARRALPRQVAFIGRWRIHFSQFPVGHSGLEAWIGRLRLGWHGDISFLTLTRTVSTFPLTRFAFRRFAIVSNITLQAAERLMAAKPLEIDFGITMSGADTDRRMPELVEIPVGRILFPECIGLPVREACIAISREVGRPRSTRFPMGDKEGANGRIATGLEILRQQLADITREEHLSKAVALA